MNELAYNQNLFDIYGVRHQLPVSRPSATRHPSATTTLAARMDAAVFYYALGILPKTLTHTDNQKPPRLQPCNHTAITWGVYEIFLMKRKLMLSTL